MASFDNTYTDKDFERELNKAHSAWMSDIPREANDLEVDGLNNTWLSRILALFGGRKS